jgi:hypothetical protein
MTANRNFYDTGVAVVHPCYYEHSQEPQAYATADSQYRFGAEMLAGEWAIPIKLSTDGSSDKTINRVLR